MRTLFTIAFLFIGGFSFSQSEASNWYFNTRGGANFNYCDNTVVGLTDGVLTTDPIGPARPSSVISDHYGNLLFYSDSRSIWNRNHQPFPNANVANGNALKGFKNSLILPKPNNPGHFYIFVIDRIGPNNNDDDGYNSGLNYSEIDMSLDGGLGDVVSTQRDIELVAYNPADADDAIAKAGNALTAVRGADCNSYWIITHLQSNFYAFKLDENGVNPNPVISTIPPVIELIPAGDGSSYFYSYSDLKASPDGSLLAAAFNSFPSDDGPYHIPGIILLYDFDNATGVISNKRNVFNGESAYEFPYVVEFSPQSNWLYAIVGDGGVAENFVPQRFLRFNLNTTNIPSSKELIEELSENIADDLQLGIDNKIYRTQAIFSTSNLDYRRYLATVNNPDAFSLSSINYEPFSVLIDINESNQNLVNGQLPNINKQWFNKRIDIVKNGLSRCELYLCGNQTETLKADNISGATYTWMKDNVVIPNETAFTLEVDAPGFYEVFVEPNNGNCPVVGFATVLLSNDIPTANNASILQCDDEIADGISSFNLDEISAEVTNNETGVDITYYETYADAQNQVNPLPLNYTNLSNPQTVYATVRNIDNGCSNISEITLEISNTNSNDVILDACDSGENDGLTTFELSEANEAITEGLPDGLTISYYMSLQDALLEINPIATTFSNTVPYSQTVFARVENANECYGISEIQLNVFELPELETEETIYYCLNSAPNTITLTGGVINDIPNNYYYDWSTGATTSEININEPGTYTVRVTNTNNCYRDRTITVLPSDIATFVDIQVTDATTNNTISVFVSGEGVYEYALDNPNGPYQESNVFETVSFGFHTIFVRDVENDCGVVEDVVSVIGFPKFFTPNGDIHHPYWQVKGISADFQPNTQILIFDRYGKLLKELDPLSAGWDGIFNGVDMPTNDYWYVVNLEDGRTLKGHFTLKR
ncbi:T9SS type B sorting domain-containing protein [Psychroserpens sp. SPM9]|uniref:T9SS type B sorting domain-containing protein n=1 Tax=Psychroserpens sp. SPM9 TaxID=2975598 RepID=UPI0021A7AF1E|nr:T9SS type B sorting domain-containing protein [Psychroserpens sp. SPM9]MDG5492379.1 T9SS type B sorting domain-containing protein [Psychroserpens sp. SPM9]